MSDLHTMPLRGRDLDYAPKAPERHKARLWWGPEGWRWEHQCQPMKWTDSGCPFASIEDATDAAVRHLEGCCA